MTTTIALLLLLLSSGTSCAAAAAAAAAIGNLIDVFCAAWLEAVDCAAAGARASLLAMYADLLQPALGTLVALGTSAAPRVGSLLVLGYFFGVGAYYFIGAYRGARDCVILRRRTLPIILRVPDGLGRLIVIDADWAAAHHGATACAGTLLAQALFWPSNVWPATLVLDLLLPAVVLLMNPAQFGLRGAWLSKKPSPTVREFRDFSEAMRH